MSKEPKGKNEISCFMFLILKKKKVSYKNVFTLQNLALCCKSGEFEV